MMAYISTILSGFSIVASFILLFAYLFFLAEMKKTAAGRIAATVTLLGLIVLQINHFFAFVTPFDPLTTRFYNLALMLLPTAFYFLAREVLLLDRPYNLGNLIHAIAPLSALFLPLQIIPPVAFLLGAVYTLGFVFFIYKLKSHTQRFKFELFFFGLFALMAVCALILGLSLPFINTELFYLAYANFISIAMAMIITALLIFPQLLSDILLVAELAYAKSKLDNIDIGQKAAELENLMLSDSLYAEEGLSLTMVANSLNLSTHQLSELVNRHFKLGFPKYIRNHRIRAACKRLTGHPSESVLSIALSVGFSSQSSFYAAFKEVKGISPTEFRNNTKQ